MLLLSCMRFNDNFRRIRYELGWHHLITVRSDRSTRALIGNGQILEITRFKKKIIKFDHYALV